MKYTNAKITQAGLYYIGHYRTACIRLELKTRGGGATVSVPVAQVGKLLEMFEDEIEAN